jgi:hypothetical protein
VLGPDFFGFARFASSRLDSLRAIRVCPLKDH